jgi:pyruvate formate lyase activating enzyme
MGEKLHEAVLWEAAADNGVRCGLCNFQCRIADGQLGHCKVRRNVGGKLYSLNYYGLCAVGVDPIEKKPLFHFQPGTRSFSIAGWGCNFQCDFCQNWQISQRPRMTGKLSGEAHEPSAIVDAAAAKNCSSIAYTYTEPTVFMELAGDCGRLARQKGLANVFVSNGYMTIEAIDWASDFLDGINVDLKSFSEDFYRDVCKASLKPVLETLRYIAKNTNIWLEVTTLVVPGANDSDDELKRMAGFIADELGCNVPWHISRFHPMFERQGGQVTPTETLLKAHGYGKEAGLRYVYVGNVPGSGYENTVCHKCGQVLIERVGYHVGKVDVVNGACGGCGAEVAGYQLTVNS